MSNEKTDSKTFEEITARINEIVTELGNVKTPLDRALVLFEEGATLIRQANEILDKAEQKVIMLTGKEESGE